MTPSVNDITCFRCDVLDQRVKVIKVHINNEQVIRVCDVSVKV